MGFPLSNSPMYNLSTIIAANTARNIKSKSITVFTPIYTSGKHDSIQLVPKYDKRNPGCVIPPRQRNLNQQDVKFCSSSANASNRLHHASNLKITIF